MKGASSSASAAGSSSGKDGAGRWRQQRTNSATKAEAQELERGVARKAEFQRSGVEPMNRAVHLTFGELLDWHLEQFGRHHRSDAMRQFAEKHLRPAFGSLPLVDVTAGRIDQLLSAQRRPRPEVDQPPPLDRSHPVLSRDSARTPARCQPGQGSKAPESAEARSFVPQARGGHSRFAAGPDAWRPKFATAIYTGMRRGELVALQRSDVDLESGTITIGRSWKANTTKGGSAAVLPIHRDLKPFLAEALRQSPSALVFPRADGSMQSENVDSRGCFEQPSTAPVWSTDGPTSAAAADTTRRRHLRRPALRVRLQALARASGSPYPVPRSAPHDSHFAPQGRRSAGGRSAHPPALLADDHDRDLRPPRPRRHALYRLDFQPTQAPVAEVLKLAVNAPHGARGTPKGKKTKAPALWISPAKPGPPNCREDRIRTCDPLVPKTEKWDLHLLLPTRTRTSTLRNNSELVVTRFAPVWSAHTDSQKVCPILVPRTP